MRPGAGRPRRGAFGRRPRPSGGFRRAGPRPRRRRLRPPRGRPVRRLRLPRGVWLPAGLLDTLDDTARAALLRAAPALRACPDCAGTGTQPCRSCGGLGRVLCANRAFHSPPKSVGEGADRKAIESTVLAPATRDPCAACGGTWDAPRAVACPDCAGRGVSACASCTGTGRDSGTR